MAYLSNIPLSTDTLSVSQANILGNFQFLGAIAGISGTPVTNSINSAGGFNWLYLTVQAIPPAGSTFPAGSVDLYSAQNPAAPVGTGKNELYINKTNSFGAIVQVPITAGVLDPLNDGWSYLGSGAILKWGQRAAMATIPVTMAGPMPTNTLAVFVTALDANAVPTAAFKVGLRARNTPSANQFVAYSIGSAANTYIQYLAICV